jgi:hypothetical protein
VMFNLSAGLFFPPKLASLHVRTLSALKLYDTHLLPPCRRRRGSPCGHTTVKAEGGVRGGECFFLQGNGLFCTTYTHTLTHTQQNHRWEHSHLAPLSAVAYLPSFAVHATAKLLSAVTRGQQYAQGARKTLCLCLSRAVRRQGV